MKFKEVKTSNALGMILGHSIKTKTQKFKKGQKINKTDISVLKENKIYKFFAAEFEENDIHENDAAELIANSVKGKNTTTKKPFTGRCNIYSDYDGVVLINESSINSINYVDESITIATLLPYALVQKGQMIATIKIIPFATSKSSVKKCIEICKNNFPVIKVAPLKNYNIGLLLTSFKNEDNNILNKTIKVIKSRIESLGSKIKIQLTCNHDELSISKGIKNLLENKCSPILINGASAIVDNNDVIPLAIRMAGGFIIHYGMPVDPGNLLLIGKYQQTYIIGLPGCAKSPRLNGFDWMLWRVLADLPIESKDIQSLGVGGLLKEIDSRPQLREDSINKNFTRKKVGAIILAAGKSERMYGKNKLLEKVNEETLLKRIIDETLQTSVDDIIVVLGHESKIVQNSLRNLPVNFAKNENYENGISSSIKTGINSLQADIDGAIIILADMPKINCQHIDKIIKSYFASNNQSIFVPVHKGKKGNPVLLDKSHFEEIKNLTGDIGAREIISFNKHKVKEIKINDTAIFFDIDTEDELKEFRSNN